MEGFECKKCGNEDVKFLESIIYQGLGKAITHIQCLNQECENNGEIVSITGVEMKCPRCRKENLELGGKENDDSSWTTWGVCHNSECKFFEQRVGV